MPPRRPRLLDDRSGGWNDREARLSVGALRRGENDFQNHWLLGSVCDSRQSLLFRLVLIVPYGNVRKRFRNDSADYLSRAAVSECFSVRTSLPRGGCLTGCAAAPICATREREFLIRHFSGCFSPLQRNFSLNGEALYCPAKTAGFLESRRSVPY